MKADIDTDEEFRLDGCQFPKFDGKVDAKRDSVNYEDAKNDPYYINKRYAGF